MALNLGTEGATDYRKKLIAMQMQSALDTSPVQHWSQGAARLAQAMMLGLEMRDQDAKDKEFGAVLQNLPGLGGAPAAVAPAPAMAPSAPVDPAAPVAPPVAPPPDGVPVASRARIAAALGQRPVQVIEGNAEEQPSPFDPPSGQDRDVAIRTMYGEDPGVSAPGVAAVLRRRAIDGNFGGNTLDQVAKAPGQFEPWARPEARARMEGLDPNSPTYKRLGAALDSTYAPDAVDPTNGATHFFAPKAQAALGRQPPSWAQGPSTTMGPHAFYGGVGGQPAPVQTAALPGVVSDAPPPGMGPPPVPASIPAVPPAAVPPPVQVAQAGQRQIPPEVAGQIRMYLGSPNPQIRALGMQLYQQHAKPLEPKFHKLDDETLFEERTGTTKAAGPGFKSLVDPAERAKYGIPAEDKRPYQVRGGKLINPPAETRVSIDQTTEKAFDTASAKHQAERFDKIVQAGFEAKSQRADIGALRDIGSRLTTGKTAEITAALGPYAEALGVKVDSLSDLQAYNAIVSKIAPRMRPAGSGATSDFEMKKYLEAIPGLGKTSEGNAIIESTMEALQNHQESAADIASRAMNKEITPREADKLLRNLPDPMTAWKESKGVKKLGEGAPSVDDLIKKYAR